MRREESTRGKISTAIVPSTDFYLAEDYHQKYGLRNSPELMAEFDKIYPRLVDFVNSTAATRVNGYVHGHGTLAQLEADAPNLGLSPQALDKLRRYVKP